MSTQAQIVASLPECLRQTYNYIYTHIELYGYPPTIRELMKVLGLKSPAPVQARLERLQAKGLIDWVKNESRTLKLIGYKVRLIPEFEETLENNLLIL